MASMFCVIASHVWRQTESLPCSSAGIACILLGSAPVVFCLAVTGVDFFLAAVGASVITLYLHLGPNWFSNATEIICPDACLEQILHFQDLSVGLLPPCFLRFRTDPQLVHASSSRILGIAKCSSSPSVENYGSMMVSDSSPCTAAILSGLASPSARTRSTWADFYALSNVPFSIVVTWASPFVPAWFPVFSASRRSYSLSLSVASFRPLVVFARAAEHSSRGLCLHCNGVAVRRFLTSVLRISTTWSESILRLPRGDPLLAPMSSASSFKIKSLSSWLSEPYSQL